MAQSNDKKEDSRPDVSAIRPDNSRLYYVDHLRFLLAILVVIHHVAVVYGAFVPGFYYVEPPYDDPGAFRDLIVFATVNQSWFMGAFFLLAGYFVPASYDRKGSKAFATDRVVRLGIPLLIFYFVLNPICVIGYWLMPTELTGITGGFNFRSWVSAYPELLGVGPTWFLALLLVFSVAYLGWRQLFDGRSAQRHIAAPNVLVIIVATLVLAGVSYLWRYVIPIGRSVIGFPSLAYLPQYLGFFLLGIAAKRFNWLRSLSTMAGVCGGIVALAAVIFLLPLAFTGEWFSLEVTDAITNGFGGAHWQSAVSALFDSVFAVGITLAALTTAQRLLASRSRIGTFLSVHSYAVYVLHMPVVIFLAYAMRGLELATIPKTAVVSIVVVPVSVLVAFVVRKIPGVARFI